LRILKRNDNNIKGGHLPPFDVSRETSNPNLPLRVFSKNGIIKNIVFHVKH